MKTTFFRKKSISTFVLLLFIGCLFFTPFFSLSVAATSTEELIADAEARKTLPVETNETEGWPQGPAIGAEAAVLLDADSGTILYGKNVHEKLYPASTTKLLTCILVAENCTMDEMVTISQSAIDNKGRNGSNMALVAGEQLTVEELLYGVLINSANEACNALAEHISGSIEAFVDLMNQKALSLGCTDAHFVTPHGYHDDNHYCSAMDLAIICKEFSKHEELCRISLELSYHIEAEDGHNHEEHYLGSHNKMLPGCSYYYEGLLCSKTGYTDRARQTLVSCAENNGLRLICVIMKEESPDQFADTNLLFSYGFNNFTSYKITEQETRFQVGHADFFNSGRDLFGSTKPLLSVSDTSSVLLPNGIPFSDTETTLSYEQTAGDIVAHILYTYHGAPVGDGAILYSGDGAETLQYSSVLPEDQKGNKDQNKAPLIINVKKIIPALLITVFIIVAVFFGLSRLRTILRKTNRTERRKKASETSSRLNYRKNSSGSRPVPAGKTSHRKSSSRHRQDDLSPTEQRARKERELLAARKAAQAEIKSRKAAMQQIIKPDLDETSEVSLEASINTYHLKDSEMTTGYAKKPLPNVQRKPKPTTQTATLSYQNQKRPPQHQGQRVSYSTMYRVGLHQQDE